MNENPFSTVLEYDPDFSQLDHRIAVNRLFEREIIADKVWRGKLHPDALFECMDNQGFKVDRYLKEVAENLDKISISIY